MMFSSFLQQKSKPLVVWSSWRLIFLVFMTTMPMSVISIPGHVSNEGLLEEASIQQNETSIPYANSEGESVIDLDDRSNSNVSLDYRTTTLNSSEQTAQILDDIPTTIEKDEGTYDPQEKDISSATLDFSDSSDKEAMVEEKESSLENSVNLPSQDDTSEESQDYVHNSDKDTSTIIDFKFDEVLADYHIDEEVHNVEEDPSSESTKSSVKEADSYPPTSDQSHIFLGDTLNQHVEADLINELQESSSEQPGIIDNFEKIRQISNDDTFANGNKLQDSEMLILATESVNKKDETNNENDKNSFSSSFHDTLTTSASIEEVKVPELSTDMNTFQIHEQPESPLTPHSTKLNEGNIAENDSDKKEDNKSIEIEASETKTTISNFGENQNIIDESEGVDSEQPSSRASTTHETLHSTESPSLSADKIEGAATRTQSTETDFKENSDNLDDEVGPDVYAGLPWGIIYNSRHHVSDMELLYRFFQNEINADVNFFNRPQSEARFPLSMGQNEQNFNNESDEDSSARQADIEEMLRASEEASKDVLKGAEVPPEMNVSSINSESEIDDVDGLRELFQGVDPPDELDVASGSSMQELLVGKGRQIIVTRLVLGVKMLQRAVKSIRNKLKEEFTKRQQQRLNDDPPDRLAFVKNLPWKESANSIMEITSSAIDSVTALIDGILNKSAADEDDALELEETFDLDAIRRMSGLKS